MSSLTVGIVGLGGAGRAHARRLRRNQNVGKIFGFDTKPVTDSGVEVVPTLDALLARVDCVSICTPDHAHFSDVVRCLEANKHVLVEKPMVKSHAEALSLGPHLARHAGLVFGVHHQMRYAPAFAKARELVVNGTLGKLFYVEANYWHDMTERALRFDDWRKNTPQSLLFGHACHPFDLLMWLLDAAPTKHKTYLSKASFSEYASPYTSSTTMFRFEGDVIGKSHINSFCNFPQVNNLMLLGDKGTYIDGILHQDGRFTQVADFFGEGKSYAEPNIAQTKISGKALSVALRAYMETMNAALRGYMETMNAVATRLMRHPDYGFRQTPFSVYNHDQACQVIIDNFVDAVRGKAKILVGYDEATRVIKLCEDTEADGFAEWGTAPPPA